LLEIATAVRAGDAQAASTLIVRLRAHTQRIVQRVLGNAHPFVEDVTQEATVALLAGLKNFRGESTVAHFASSVAIRVALSARRRMNISQRRLPIVASYDLTTEVDPQTPLTVAIDSQKREVILGILSELPPTIAETLTLVAVLGYTTAEAATILRVTEGTVRSYLRAGKQEFRRLLRRERRKGYIV
jgi:RNA polymerase sigma factor (sigma-70 family)